ncbi:MAG: 3-oxoacyl-[acyl-carrier-protein] reductase [Deltaproteobacteria bacterium]|nr:3-oxoacyl-[acyl-carrier-protein] reductase [Deltaproteobacteria bacterium]MBI3754586.1 3-oxoacyl-[acyl-carrier-protein] reductase [Deltaproteobacteria bacterium]
MRENLLLNKVAIVTGGTRGIGRSIVMALAKEGADCIFTYLQNRDLAEPLVDEVNRIGRRALPLQMDVADFENSKIIIEKVKETFGRLDILINNAGIIRDKSLMMMSKDDWSAVIDTDLTGVFNTTRACIITFLKQKSGNIINISSVNGVHPLPGQVNYAAAKAGVIGFTKSLAREVAPYNIRVNAVAPGFIETDMTKELDQGHRKKFLDMIPLGKFGTAEEVAQTVIFLASDKSHYITGQTIQIDGGLGM